MTAYFVAQFTVKDPAVLSSYSQKAAPVIASYGGELLFKSPMGEALDGLNPHKGIAVFRFPSDDAMKNCHASDAYQSLVSERREGADMVITGYTAPAG
ncbi:DUF1330 domain-containing protein [Pelagibius sp. Alg239-R121]|uniref:DUF1330 domain-containing protein n=1 Tax=Pelagibius sp. Alg239-R121 TaxID=2993448 RepID=UPI0024A6E782|nr:DUF1330 domain-containing protein [Pelagibius sp. Alg239-R121]